MIHTRFPPEPNGYLHLGHVKAMLIDFEKHLPNCDCVIRMDDSNPETEKQEYVDAVIKDVGWMGFKWSRVTYCSDYFAQLLEFAWKLVWDGKAYIDFSTSDEMAHQRGKRVGKEGNITWAEPYESPYRNTEIKTNALHFQKMIDGEYPENKCVLRLKMDALTTNPNMRDPVAYRVKFTPHYRTKDKWCVYPAYDYAHCMVDALEKIDYSYCTLEFETRRVPYFWVLEQLDLHKPVVYEFSRLNVKGNILSKRTINSFIEKGYLSGFDDPRLLTICGLRRRGYTPSALKTTIRTLGHNKKDGITNMELFEHNMRKELEGSAPRIFGLKEPLCMQIVNWEKIANDKDKLEFTRPINPMNVSQGTRMCTLTKKFYIEKSDFRPQANRKYYRLTQKQPVRLKYADGIIRYVEHTTDENGEISQVVVEFIPDTTTKVRACIGWLNDSPTKVNLNIFGPLLLDNGEYNPKSLVQIQNACIEGGCLKQGDRCQIERVGFFFVEAMETLNEIVPLKASKYK